MTTPLLTVVLEPIVRRHRMQRTLVVAAVGLLVLFVIAVALHMSGNGSRFSALLIIIAKVLVWIIAWRSAARWSCDYREIARRIEAQHPELHSLLLTAVEQQPDAETGRLNFLQQRIVAEASAKARSQNWLSAVPSWRLAGLGAIAFVITVFLIVFVPTLARPAHDAARPVVFDQAVEITPGDVSLERGSGLIVLAKFNRDVPGAATLVLQPKNEPEQRMPLVKNLDDPVFGGGLPEVQGDLTYRIEYAGAATRDFTVKVFEHPRLDRADATLHFPEYTKLPDKSVPETRRVSAVEGTQLDVAFALN